MNIKKNFFLLIITFIVSCSPATQSSEDAAPDGYKMLLMGNSFFIRNCFSVILTDLINIKS